MLISRIPKPLASALALRCGKLVQSTPLIRHIINGAGSVWTAGPRLGVLETVSRQVAPASRPAYGGWQLNLFAGSAPYKVSQHQSGQSVTCTREWRSCRRSKLSKRHRCHRLGFLGACGISTSGLARAGPAALPAVVPTEPFTGYEAIYDANRSKDSVMVSIVRCSDRIEVRSSCTDVPAQPAAIGLCALMQRANCSASG